MAGGGELARQPRPVTRRVEAPAFRLDLGDSAAPAVGDQIRRLLAQPRSRHQVAGCQAELEDERPRGERRRGRPLADLGEVEHAEYDQRNARHELPGERGAETGEADDGMIWSESIGRRGGHAARSQDHGVSRPQSPRAGM